MITDQAHTCVRVKLPVFGFPKKSQGHQCELGFTLNLYIVLSTVIYGVFCCLLMKKKMKSRISETRSIGFIPTVAKKPLRARESIFKKPRFPAEEKRFHEEIDASSCRPPGAES